jgi:environmental stress-induced protein Ves
VNLAARPQPLPAALRTAVPWKNGGGLTREVAAYPEGAALADFDWRVSTAEVRNAGPFSLFPGVQRTLCVLQGTLALEVEGRQAVRLGTESAPHGFSGDAPAHAQPGPEGVVDLNVMTRRGRFSARVAALQFTRPVAHQTSSGVTLLFACVPLTVTVPGAAFPLARWDALKVTGATACTLAAAGAQGSCYLIEIAAEGRGIIGGGRRLPGEGA